MSKIITIGVYALIKDNNVYYVGSSINVEVRIKQHSKYGKIPISYLLLEQCSKIHLLAQERYWIQHFIKQGVILSNTKMNKGVKIPLPSPEPILNPTEPLKALYLTFPQLSELKASNSPQSIHNAQCSPI